MTTQLAELRSRLGALRRKRQVVRQGAAWSAVATALLWALLAAFLIDWSLHTSRLQRVVLIAALAGVAYWAFRRFALPWLKGSGETDIDVALMVQKNHHIDSDLVAALQFESPAADSWGSQSLRQEVIKQVAKIGGALDVFRGFSQEALVRRGTIAGVTAAIVLGLAAIFPGHSGAFLNRLFMGRAHYPTRTHLDDITLRLGKAATELSVFPKSPAAAPASPERQPVVFAVSWSGEAPVDEAERRRVVLRTDSGRGREIELPLSADGEKQFTATLPQLIDSLTYQVYLGDAWTEPAPLDMNALPRVEVTPVVTPPAYASAKWSAGAASADGARHITVLEGSQVALAVKSENKSLEQVLVQIGEDPIVTASNKAEALKASLQRAAPDLRSDEQRDLLIRWKALHTELVDSLSKLVARVEQSATAKDPRAKQFADKALAVIRKLEPLLVVAPPEPVASTDPDTPAEATAVAQREAWNTTFSNHPALLAGCQEALGILGELAGVWVDGVPLVAAGEDQKSFTLDPKKTPLERITQRLDYQVFVRSADGLDLERPLSGRIMVKADQRPRVAAGMITLHVLPTARPKLLYEAADDFGVSELRLKVRFDRGDGDALEVQQSLYRLAADAAPVNHLKNQFTLDLSALARQAAAAEGNAVAASDAEPLEKGHRIIVDLEVVDIRGPVPGMVSSLSEPLILNVTDERGVLAAMIEQDKRSFGQLEAIIERELGIGDQP